MAVGDVSEAADGVFFLGIIQSASHKIEINLSAAMSKIKTGSQPLYLGQHHCQQEVPLCPCPCQLLPWPWVGGGGRGGGRCEPVRFFFFFHSATSCWSQKGSQGPANPSFYR